MLRSLKDAREISARLAAARRVVVVGGGFIGLEVAAAARKKGVEALVLEAQDRLMARAVTPKISQAFADLHRARGVEFHFGAVARSRGRRRRARWVADGAGFFPPIWSCSASAPRRRLDRRRGGPRLQQGNRCRLLRPDLRRQLSRRAIARSGGAATGVSCGWKASRTRWSRARPPPPP